MGRIASRRPGGFPPPPGRFFFPTKRLTAKEPTHRETGGERSPFGKIPRDGAAEGDGEGVGGVGGDRVADAEEAGDHPGDLLLGGAAVPGRRRLDLLGAVFVDDEAVGAACDDRGAAGLAELEGGRGVFREEDFLDRGFRGPMEVDQVGEFAMDP